MSGRGGIYEGPNGEQLHGDGREVNEAMTAKASAGAKEIALLVKNYQAQGRSFEATAQAIDSHLEPLLRAARACCEGYTVESDRDELRAELEKWKPGR